MAAFGSIERIHAVRRQFGRWHIEVVRDRSLCRERILG
jgi:hypothetical protein